MSFSKKKRLYKQRDINRIFMKGGMTTLFSTKQKEMKNTPTHQ